MINNIALMKDYKNTITTNPGVCSLYVNPVMQTLIIGFEGRNHAIVFSVF
jgi:hypothetical protein